MQHRPSESEKKTLKKWTTVEGVDRAEAPEDTTDSHSAIPLPPPLPFVFPGSLSTKTGEKLTANTGQKTSLIQLCYIRICPICPPLLQVPSQTSMRTTINPWMKSEPSFTLQTPTSPTRTHETCPGA
ncbi:Myosin 15 [Caligus rogercresseyi]|uniref:Myosin 15 n=1 Tax=Caligus rogercresseyi TaxID=217165 RepID=A0A7T8KC10_CALRO|nr:Myosin 15 [Caligus rogercresseyi]